MDEKITITIDNYNNKKIIYRIPKEGVVNIFHTEDTMGENPATLVHVNLEISCITGVEREEQDLI